jgi:hypothetical protein
MRFAKSRNLKFIFMMKTELDWPGSGELSDQEMKTLYGGAVSPIRWGAIWDSINNFGDIREGLSDAFSGKPPRY